MELQEEDMKQKLQKTITRIRNVQYRLLKMKLTGNHRKFDWDDYAESLIGDRVEWKRRVLGFACTST